MACARPKAHKGVGMEGFVATWYTRQTAKDLDEFKALARRIAAHIEPGARVLEIAPGPGERRVSFGNSGAEAVEGAIKLARWSTGRDKIIAFFGSFHGRTMGALSLTARKAVQRSGFGPLIPGVVHAPYPNCYRCPFGKEPEGCAVECVKHIEDTLLKTIAPAEETAAIVVEPVHGEGGYVIPPRKFFDELARVAQQNGILLVFDEVQSGMGRTGKMWAADHFEAVRTEEARVPPRARPKVEQAPRRGSGEGAFEKRPLAREPRIPVNQGVVVD